MKSWNANKIEGGFEIAYEEATTSNGQVYMTCQSSIKDEWILNLGYTFHMTPYKEHFNFLKLIEYK